MSDEYQKLLAAQKFLEKHIRESEAMQAESLMSPEQVAKVVDAAMKVLMMAIPKLAGGFLRIGLELVSYLILHIFRKGALKNLTFWQKIKHGGKVISLVIRMIKKIIIK